MVEAQERYSLCRAQADRRLAARATPQKNRHRAAARAPLTRSETFCGEKSGIAAMPSSRTPFMAAQHGRAVPAAVGMLDAPLFASLRLAEAWLTPQKASRTRRTMDRCPALC
jgi:hypothetical protein